MPLAADGLVRSRAAAPTTHAAVEVADPPSGVASMSTMSPMMHVTLSGAPAASASCDQRVGAVARILDLEHGVLCMVSRLTTPERPSEHSIHRSPGLVSRTEMSTGTLASMSPSTRRSIVALGVVFRVRDGQPAGVDEVLHERVVGRDLVEFAVAQQIRARVADVRHRERGARAQQRGHGGAQPLSSGSLRARPTMSACAVGDRRP